MVSVTFVNKSIPVIKYWQLNIFRSIRLLLLVSPEFGATENCWYLLLSSGSSRSSNQTALMEKATWEDLYVVFFNAYLILIWWFIVQWFSPCCLKNVDKMLRRSIDLYWPINCNLLVPILPRLYFSSPLLLMLPLFSFPWLFFPS